MMRKKGSADDFPEEVDYVEVHKTSKSGSNPRSSYVSSYLDRVIADPTSLEMVRRQAETGALIPLWPYGDRQSFEDLDFSKQLPEYNQNAWGAGEKSESERLITRFLYFWFGAVFFLGLGFLFGERTSGFYFYHWHFIIGGVIVLAVKFCRSSRGCSFIVLGDKGLTFLWALDDSIERFERIDWFSLSSIKLVKTGLMGKIKVRFSSDRINNVNIDIPLESFPNQERWKVLVESARKYSEEIEMDDSIAEALMPDAKDTTYTELWLEALGSPPKRERLLPLGRGTELKDQYRVVKKVGSGGQGTAYLCNSNVIGDGEFNDAEVVLKEYMLPVYVDINARKQAIENFESEARMLSKLDCDSIVRLIDFFVEDHRAYLVLEYIKGENLEEYVRKNGPMTESDAIKIGIEMCDILSYLQSQEPKIVHRDFTPDNLMRTGDNKIKLIDFMVAQELENVGLTSAVVGKQAYMPREQFKGKVSIRSDIYALGAGLYYILTGEEPEPLSRSLPILKREDLNPRLSEIVAKATEQDENKRYVSAEELKKDLEELLIHYQGMLTD